MSKYFIHEFSDERLQEVSEDWMAVAGEDEFTIELAPFFDWCKANKDRREGYGQALELRDEETGNAVAVLEVIDSRHASLSKLLKLMPSPRFWGVLDESVKLEKLIEVYVAAYGHMMALGFAKGFKDVKIYGRRDGMYTLLKELQNSWPAKETNSVAVMEGRWLRITNKENQ